MSVSSTSSVLELADNFFILPGAVNTGVLRVGTHAVLFDCCDTVTSQRLAELGIESVDLIFFTQPRRPNIAGSYPFVQAGAELVAAADARALYEEPLAYWDNWARRYVGAVTKEGRTYLSLQPVNEVPVQPLPLAHPVADGDIIEWQGFRIQAHRLRPIEGSLAFTVEVAGQCFCFAGDYLHSAGRFWELHPFQETYGDLHGFGAADLTSSLQKIADTQADVVIPSHGRPIADVQAAIAATIAGVREVLETYKTIMWSDNSLLTDAPPFVVRIPRSTGHAVIADDGSALLADLGDDCAIWELVELQKQGVFKTIDAVYVTHYHGDHHWAMNHLFYYFPDCRVIADVHQADILRHPARYGNRCITSRPIPVHHAAEEGERWMWKEYSLTNYHLPAHAYYHGALLVEGHGRKLLFTGDSLAQGLMAGEYCAHNRMLVGEDAGGLRSLRVLDDTDAELIFCGHGDRPSRWTRELLERKRAAYRRREQLLTVMVAQAHPNFALDPEWATTYPYEQEAAAGTVVRLDVVFSNYGPADVVAETELLLPPEWVEESSPGQDRAVIAAGATGAVQRRLRIPEDTASGLYVLPVRITWDGRYLGQYRQALVRVWD